VGGLSFKAADERTVGEFSLGLAQAGVAVLELSPRKATLEELFFRLTEDGASAESDAAEPSEPVTA
jgi:hypothetical protein